VRETPVPCHGPCHACPSLATLARALPRVPEPCHGPCHGCPSLATDRGKARASVARTVASVARTVESAARAVARLRHPRQGPWQGSAKRGKARRSLPRVPEPCHGCPGLATGGRALPRSLPRLPQSLPRLPAPCHGPFHGCPSLATGLATGGGALPRSKTPWPRWRRVLRSHGFLEFHFQGCDVLLGGWQTVGGSQVSRSFSGLGTSDSL